MAFRGLDTNKRFPVFLQTLLLGLFTRLLFLSSLACLQGCAIGLLEWEQKSAKLIRRLRFFFLFYVVRKKACTSIRERSGARSRLEHLGLEACLYAIGRRCS